MVEQELTKEELEAFNETWGIAAAPQKKDSSVLPFAGAIRKYIREKIEKLKKTS